MCHKLHMTSVDVRELRQRASELLRLAEGGETIKITDRGPLARLRAAGDVRPVEDDDEFPEPLLLAAGQEAPSVTLARLRRDER